MTKVEVWYRQTELKSVHIEDIEIIDEMVLRIPEYNIWIYNDSYTDVNLVADSYMTDLMDDEDENFVCLGEL